MYIAVCGDQRNELDNYGVRVLDYLLKPIQTDKLFSILNRLLLREMKGLPVADSVHCQ